MKVRWPQSAPCLSPPATAKFAFAPDGPVIHPPPVTKSPLGQGGGPAHEMSACADAMTTSATPVTVTWSALTVMSPGPPVCSLMTTWPWPLGKVIVWLGSPETTIAWPLITSSAISGLAWQGRKGDLRHALSGLPSFRRFRSLHDRHAEHFGHRGLLPPRCERGAVPRRPHGRPRRALAGRCWPRARRPFAAGTRRPRRDHHGGHPGLPGAHL